MPSTFRSSSTRTPPVHSSIRQSHGTVMCSPRMRVITILTVSTNEGSVYINRGERWRCFGGSHIHGCDGLWHGVLLSSDHFPSVQCPRGQTGLRCACTGCPNHGRPAHCRLSIQRADALQLALTAASPLWRGYIADVDCRWNAIAGSVDDRTEEERGLKVWCGDLRPRATFDGATAPQELQIRHSQVTIWQYTYVHLRGSKKPTRIY